MLDAEKIEKDYFEHEHEHELTYADDFLTPKAINLLRKSLLGSTILNDVKPGGYLGAYLKDVLA